LVEALCRWINTDVDVGSVPLAPDRTALDNGDMARRKQPTVTVRNLKEALEAARTAADLGIAITIASPPGAALFAGPVWFKALADAARKRLPSDAAITFMLDCADSPGAALASIRCKVEAISFRGNAKARAAVAAIAKRAGVAVMEPPGDAFDLSRSVGMGALAAFFSPSGGSLQTPRRSAKRTPIRGPARRSAGGAKRPRSGAKRT
jgi:hypothetical protein